MQHYFLCSAPDVIHLPHPSELIYWLQMLRHTFRSAIRKNCEVNLPHFRLGCVSRHGKQESKKHRPLSPNAHRLFSKMSIFWISPSLLPWFAWKLRRYFDSVWTFLTYFDVENPNKKSIDRCRQCAKREKSKTLKTRQIHRSCAFNYGSRRS